MTLSLPPVKTSQPQPEPNCLAVVSLKVFLKASKSPKSVRDLLGDVAGGMAADAGRVGLAHDGPEHGVVGVASAVVADGGANIFGNGVQIADEVVNGFGGEIGVIGQGGIDVGDVGLVMLVVVEVHGFGVDERLERAVVVGKRW